MAKGELILLFSGCLILAGAAILYLTGSLPVFFIAKIFYGVGVILFLFNK